MAFWAVEVVPGKEYNTAIPFDLHLTQLVLPASATDKGRTVVQAKFSDQAFAVGSLKLDLQENINVDLIFEAGQNITFTVAGKNPVQLLGYYIDNQGVDGDDDDSDDELGSLDGLGAYGDEDDDDEIDSDDEDEEIDEAALTGATLQSLAQKRKAEAPHANGAKKAKVEESPQHPKGESKPQQQHQKGQQQKGEQKGQQQKGEQKGQQQKGEQKGQQQKGEQKPQQQKGEQKPQQQKGEQKPQQQKGEQKPQQQKGEQKPQQEKGEQKQQHQKGEQKPQTPGKEQQKQGGQQQQQKVLEGTKRLIKGVTVQTKTIGLGAIAELGKKVQVMYVGKLENGKVFDKSQTPFAFHLGVGEVIAGWDIGVDGMRVGEKRTLTIPPKLGYGAAGAPPDIPKNATLIFDVELIRV